MARVHSLQKVESFWTADLADDDAVWAHTKTVFDEIAHGNFALALKVRGPRLKTDHMRLL
jgi:hypothetical protein